MTIPTMKPNSINNSDLYKEVATNCLKKAYPKMYPSIRNEFVETSDYETLEAYVNASSSISTAFYSFNKSLKRHGLPGLEEDVAVIASENILHTESFLLEKLREQIDKSTLDEGTKAQIIVNALIDVHDHRVSKFGREWFFRYDWRNKQWRFLPASLIGFEELYKNRIFVEPIIKRLGLHIDFKYIIEAYEGIQAEYFTANRIEGYSALERHIRNLKYPAAPEYILTVIRHYRSTNEDSLMPTLIRTIDEVNRTPWVLYSHHKAI